MLLNHRFTRHAIAAVLLVLAGRAFSDEIEALDPNFASPSPEGGIVWYDALQLGLIGQGWTDLATPYDRLPAKAEGVVREPVWSLSQRTSGLAVRFRSDSPKLAARWSLRLESLDMPHMPSTGVSGLDLYARDQGAWRWVAGARPKEQNDNEANLASSTPGGMQEYLLYLPLYNGITKLEIGVWKDSVLAKADQETKRPIVFYGTSITNGGCASRPGMAYPALVGRRLDWPAINLGFSGNGKMEPELADLLAELDPAVYVLDCLPNMNPELVRERVAPFVHTLRKAHPDTPILLVENIVYQGAWFHPGPSSHELKNEALREVYAALQAEGVEGLYYLPGDNYLGNDGLATVDGTHPTDLGFFRQADALEPVLRGILEK
ncbi:MAG: hypothetical protein GC168_19530 [Candidatus Hydrogenedens sp.]|nr:hypothetical protein [Candidatus Hydrogenedens sp.]